MYKNYAEAAAAAIKPSPAQGGNRSSFVQTRCLHCEREGIIVLKCAQHKLCQNCLPKNIVQFGSDKESMYRCPAEECAVPDTPLLPIWIFVDNSNIWIGAKYLANNVKGFKSKQDHRVRLSIGKLTDVVSKKRPVRQGTLYGSEPPQIDSVWEKIREHGWVVKTKKKSDVTRKEKEVDAQLLVDVTELACTTPRYERSTIVLITGDADMCPAVQKIMEYEGWEVEIYMWEQSLSNRLKDLSKKNERVSCQSLDNHITDVTFTNKRFPVDPHRGIPADSSAVLTMEPSQFPKRIFPDKWWNRLESIAQWPVQYSWIIRDEKETDDLLLVFNHQGQSKKYDVSDFVQKINKNKLEASEEPILPHVERAETYVDYKRRLKRFEAVVKYGLFKISDSDDLESDSNFLESSNKEIFKRRVFQGFHVVDAHPTSSNTNSTDGNFKSVPPSQVGGQDKTCRFGKNCIRGLECDFKHSDKDKMYFEGHGGKGNPFRKTRLCKKSRCLQDPEKCDYAHGEEDGWCLNCRQHGHFSQACSNPTQ